MKYANYLLLEQVRQLQGEDYAVDEHSPDLQGDYEQRLLQRANTFVAQEKLEAVLKRPERLYKRCLALAVVVAAVFAVLAVSNALFIGSGEANTINIYWLLLVLLVFNAISIILWVLGCFTGLGNLVAGSVGRLPTKLLSWFGGRAEPASAAWYECRFGGRLGVWHFSVLSHRLWLVYLFVGLITLVVLFSVRQYDFFWGSTLLSGDAFTTLTEWLSWPMSKLGLPVPDVSQINSSRAGLAGSEPDSRRVWAIFLLAALLIYGILPRLICWLWAKLQLLRKEKQFRPDYYLPYYVGLRQQLFPPAAEASVVDADEYPVDKVTEEMPVQAELRLPENALLVGLETSRSLASKLDLNIIDTATLGAAIDRTSTASRSVVAVADSRAAPDRGLQRRLNSLLERVESDKRWLLVSGTNTSSDSQRLADWYAAAKQAGIPAKQVQVGKL